MNFDSYRVATQLTFCSPRSILRRAVVERDVENRITRIFNLDDSAVESAHTLFFDGILSAELISIKKWLSASEINQCIDNYQYFDFSASISSTVIVPSNRPLLLDFGSNSLAEMNAKLAKLSPLLVDFDIFDLIAACTFYPALVIGKTSALEVNRKTHLLLWEGADLVNKKCTDRICIRVL